MSQNSDQNKTITVEPKGNGDSIASKPDATSESKKRRFVNKKTVCLFLLTALGVGLSFGAEEEMVFFLILYFVGFPFIYLLLRYIWLRLCRDPFLSQRYENDYKNTE